MKHALFHNVQVTYIRGLSIRHNSILSTLQNTSPKGKLFHLTSNNPYLNLSIENYIFEKCHSNSRILLFYTNRPCIVLGRNQNPWIEANLSLLRSGILDPATNSSLLKDVDLVRRRSGGGTVFHDEGNVNWSVICNTNEFTRDKHAELVVRALRRLGIERARVNERHDIVLDQGTTRIPVDEGDLHVTPFGSSKQSFKVSGSAYKLSRGKALHHGTALCNSHNLQRIGMFLRSPAAQFISAKGVDSVRSPITNLGIENQTFCDAVEEEFRRDYGIEDVQELGQECSDIDDIRTGYEELRSDNWRFLQTPQFTMEIASEEVGQLKLQLKHGMLLSLTWTMPTADQVTLDVSARDIELHKIQEWTPVLEDLLAKQDSSATNNEASVIDTFASQLHRLLSITT